MARNFSIFGSCVTRDVFGFGPYSDLVDCYSARCTIASAVSESIKDFLDSDGSEVQGVSSFERKMIRNDIDKLCLNFLAESAAPEIIIDLIDERFSLIDVDGRYVTESASFVKTGLLDRVQGNYEKRLFLDREDIDREALRNFSSKIEMSGKRVFIHRALWATSFVEGDQVHEFEKIGYYSRMNEGLVWRYDLLSRLLPEAVVIDIPAEFRVSDPAHRWGLAPFHYVPRYYERVREQLGLG